MGSVALMHSSWGTGAKQAATVYFLKISENQAPGIGVSGSYTNGKEEILDGFKTDSLMAEMMCSLNTNFQLEETSDSVISRSS